MGRAKPEWRAESKFDSRQPRGGLVGASFHNKADRAEEPLWQPGNEGEI